MSKELLWKWLLIIIVVGAAIFFAYPPEEKIALGLDLQGGAHILMEVDTASAIKYQSDLAQTRIGQALQDEEIPYDAVRATGIATLEITGVPSDRVEDAEKILDRLSGDWRLSAIGTGAWRMTMPPDLQVYFTDSAINTTKTILENRVDQLGLKEPTIARQGLQGDRILVQLPGVEDVNQIKDVIEEPALLEWKAVTYPPGLDARLWGPAISEEQLLTQFGGALPDDTAIFTQVEINDFGEETGQTLYYPLKRVSTVAGEDLRNAYRDVDEWGKSVVNFELTQDAAGRFEVATRAYVGKQMAIVLDGEVLSAPVIRSVIRDQGVISGGFTTESAEKLAVQLRSGALPAKISIIEERTVGPSLGRDSIRAGVMAATFGFVLVLLFMVIYYRRSGINAVVALALNILLVLGAMAYFGATLTLPGIAGLVLVVGMAVDSNVLIFERIREELRVGKTVRSAVEQGFSRAFMTILDCNVTTLVAAFFLFSYGTGPVRGFAVTLIIGLMASMFTAVFVSRQIFELVLGRKKRVESLSI
jgi:preprotein translocase subunit SecD